MDDMVADGGRRVLVGDLPVVVVPGRTVDLHELPPYSIALDGVVQGPVLDLRGRRLSFDHHGNCIRLVTTATCRQVADALLLGLDPRRYTAYVNDVDGDTALAVALLANPDWLAATSPFRGQVRRLVEAVASRDAHGPAYPVADPDLLAAFAARVPLPSRRSGGVDAPRMAADLSRCMAAIAELAHDLADPRNLAELALDPAGPGDPAGQADAADPARPAGRPRRYPADGTAPAARARPAAPFRITHAGTGWVMATSETDAFDRVYEAGHTRVVMWRSLPDGSTAYTVGRRSDLVDGFPVGPVGEPGTILGALAAREPGWGGGSSIGGAPRRPDGSRSSLPPDEVFTIVEETVIAAG